MLTPLTVSRSDDGMGTHRLLVAGELDEDTSDDLAGQLESAAGQFDVIEVVVDLRQVRFLAAGGSAP